MQYKRNRCKPLIVDDFVLEGVGETGIIQLIVAPAPETIHVDENFLAELPLVVECDLSGFENHLEGKTK
jgi:hypothetical protein